MLFNSLDFTIFLPLVFFLYWALLKDNRKGQNALLVAASYIFYGWWDWRFLSLLFISSLIDYAVGIGLSKHESREKRKLLLWISILCNLGLLGFFKYYNFFLDSFIDAFTFFGQHIEARSLNIVLPVGISFYTFQTMSYSIDVYRKKLEPANDFIAFSAFVSFFPQLVAGPIERATHLLPQFYVKREFNYARAMDGMRQALWGFFKKIVIADNCAEYANQIFNNSESYTGIALLTGAVLFAFQIYGDFSGYSDIAIGTSRLFGFDLMQNFAFPYFSRDMAEFWRRWHISLSTWFRDYLYIPLGGSRVDTLTKIRNTFIIFAVSGFWHGANWTFLAWGILNAIYFLPLLLTDKNRLNIEPVAAGRYLPNVREAIMMATTFGLTVFAWIFFRSSNIQHAIQFITDMVSNFWTLQAKIQTAKVINTLGWGFWILFVSFILIEWQGRSQKHPLEVFAIGWTKPLRLSLYYVLVISIFLYSGKNQEFIYFQF